MRLHKTYQKTVFKQGKTVRQKQGLQYAYCENNPINNVDRDGRWSKSVHHEMIDKAVNQMVKSGEIKKQTQKL